MILLLFGGRLWVNSLYLLTCSFSVCEMGIIMPTPRLAGGLHTVLEQHIEKCNDNCNTRQMTSPDHARHKQGAVRIYPMLTDCCGGQYSQRVEVSNVASPYDHLSIW